MSGENSNKNKNSKNKNEEFGYSYYPERSLKKGASHKNLLSIGK